MPEINWNELPVPPSERFRRNSTGDIVFILWNDGEAALARYETRSLYADRTLEDACAVAEVAWRKRAEQLQAACNAACSTDNDDGTMNCNHCPCECAIDLGNNVHRAAHVDIEAFKSKAAAWREAYDTLREEQEK